MITFKSVNKIFTNKHSSKHVLHDISFTVNQGEIFGIVGESGAGKTTLLKLLLQLEKPSSGSIHFNNNDLSVNSFKKTFRSMSASVFQDANLLHNINCYNNVYLPLKLRKTKDTGQVHQSMAFVGLSGFDEHFPSTLSGGEKQRLSIARALVQKPKILICDEPTAALDYQSTQNMIQLFANIQKTYGTTIIIVSHDLSFAKAICNRVALIDKGRLETIYENKQNQETNSPNSYKEYVEGTFA